MPSIVNTFKDSENPLIWVIDFTEGIVVSDSQYFAPPIPDVFNGHASMHVTITSGQVTIQGQSDNSGQDKNFITGYDTAGTVLPALCTALTTSKFFAEINLPAARRNRWKFTESSGSAPVTGIAYLYLRRDNINI